MKNLLLRICALFRAAPTLGHVEAIPNRQRQLGECDFYLRIPVVEAGRRCYLLLTSSQFSVARQRAIRNQEDCPLPRSLLSRFLWPVLRSTSYRALMTGDYVPGESIITTEDPELNAEINRAMQAGAIRDRAFRQNASADSVDSLMNALLSSDPAVAASVGVTPLGRVFRRSEPCDCDICKNSRSQIAPR